jgi:serine/threonine protein phosphatase PrpC
MQTVTYAARTDVGKTRNHNEDCYRVNADLGLYVIADGMGGHASGEVASEIAVTTIEQQIEQGADLTAAIEQAHLAILHGVTEGAGKPGMGTTVVAAQMTGNDYTLAWVGDSRAYLWDDGISQLSKDHSLVQMLVDSGQITLLQARNHPRKNIIFQNLGARDVAELQVSIKQGALYKNQKIILCSDGLSDEVDDEEIADIIAEAGNAGSSDNELVENLVAAALHNGGSDNVTVIVISAGSDAPDKPLSHAQPHKIDKDTLIPES